MGEHDISTILEYVMKVNGQTKTYCCAMRDTSSPS